MQVSSPSVVRRPVREAGRHTIRCLVEQWKDCEELEPKPKEKGIFVDKEE